MFYLLLPGWVVPTIIGGVIALVVIILIGVIVGAYNAFVRMRNTCEEAWATIDVYLKKRYDLIPNLVETVKGYSKHESETLQKVIAARSAAMGAKTPEEKMTAEKEFSGSIRTFISAVSESYPDLKANTNFLDLQNQLKNIESELESARRYYNGVVKSFNIKTEVFPSSIVAKRKGYEKRPYFELDSAEERKNVKVQF